MAEEKAAEEAPEGKKSNKKMMIIIAIVAVLAIGVSVGVTVFLLGGKTDAATAEPAAPAEPVKKEAIYYDITTSKSPFIVTFNVNGHQRYMQAFVTALIRDQSVADALEQHKPIIRSRIISLYGAQDFEKLQTAEGKEALRKATLDTINKMLEDQGVTETVEQILFTNFVMQ